MNLFTKDFGKYEKLAEELEVAKPSRGGKIETNFESSKGTDQTKGIK